MALDIEDKEPENLNFALLLESAQFERDQGLGAGISPKIEGRTDLAELKEFLLRKDAEFLSKDDAHVSPSIHVDDWEPVFEYPETPEELTAFVSGPGKKAEDDVVPGFLLSDLSFIYDRLSKCRLPRSFVLARRTATDSWVPFNPDLHFSDEFEVARAGAVVIREVKPFKMAASFAAVIDALFETLNYYAATKRDPFNRKALKTLIDRSHLLGFGMGLYRASTDLNVVRPLRSGRASATAARNRKVPWEQQIYAIALRWCAVDTTLTLGSLVDKIMEFKATPEGKMLKLPGYDAIKRGVKRMENYPENPLKIPKRRRAFGLNAPQRALPPVHKA